MIKIFQLFTVATLLLVSFGVNQVGAEHERFCAGLSESQCRNQMRIDCGAEPDPASCKAPVIDHLDEVYGRDTTGPTTPDHPDCSGISPALCIGQRAAWCAEHAPDYSGCLEHLTEVADSYESEYSDPVGDGSELFEIRWNNPLSVGTIEELILALLNIAMVIAIPIITLFIVYAGFLYVTAQGNAEKVRTATTALTFAIIGAILIIGAVAVTTILGTTINEFTAP